MRTRRQFIKLSGEGLLAAGVMSGYRSPVSPLPPKNAVLPDAFSLGIAGYTFARLSVERSIEIMNRAGVKNLSLKDIHLPLNSNQEQIKALLEKFTSSGINVYTVGVIYMKTRESVDQAFAYAKMAGVKMIVGAPEYELLPYVEEKIREYGFRLAIHNHGPDNPLFPNSTDIWNHIREMDPRIGICIDIGHTIRDGQDPAADIKKYRDRIFDLHIKDVDKASKEGKTVEMGRGIIDIPKVVETLRKIKYTGRCSLEYEKEMEDPLAGITESIGYFRGVMACK